jgi:hypothetical protein
VVAERRDRFDGTGDPATPDLVARACVRGPEATADPGIPIRLAVAAVAGVDRPDRPGSLMTPGMIFYRADRIDGAIRRPDEAILIQGGESGPRTRASLAMVHHRRGHRDEARRWLTARGSPGPTPTRPWDERELCVLRSEAVAVALLDPAFPDDPFTP